MSFVIHALALFSALTTPAFDRAETVLKGSAGFHSDLKIVFAGKSSFTGKFSTRDGKVQRLSVKGNGLDEEYAQSEGKTLYLDHTAHEYTEYPPISTAVEAPPDSSAVMQMSLVPVFAKGSLTALAPKEQWKPAGTEVVSNRLCDILTVSQSATPSEADPYRVWIDSNGKIQRIRIVEFNGPESVTCVVDFLTSTYDALPAESFAVDLPWGYVPSRLPVTFETQATGAPARLDGLHAWPSGVKTTVDTKSAVIVLFTSNDLEPQDQVNDWKRLAEQAKKRNIRFIQIWIGVEPKPGKREWDVFWDKDGTVERRFGPPVTPYLLGIKDSTIICGWQGSFADEKDMESLFTPLTAKD